MSYGIKAIETHYKGYRFRSRLEARYAVLFDSLRIRWEYEPQGYLVGGDTPYLPDFLLLRDDQGTLDVFAEIKPLAPNDAERFKARELAVGTGKVVAIFVGMPGDEEFWFFRPGDPAWMVGTLAEQRWDSGLVEKAIIAARSARFEHGETPR